MNLIFHDVTNRIFYRRHSGIPYDLITKHGTILLWKSYMITMVLLSNIYFLYQAPLNAKHTRQDVSCVFIPSTLETILDRKCADIGEYIRGDGNELVTSSYRTILTKEGNEVIIEGILGTKYVQLVVPGGRKYIPSYPSYL